MPTHSWDKTEEVAITAGCGPVCPLCNCQEAKVARKEKDGTLVRCAFCSFLYVLPRPTEEELRLRYDSEYFESGDLRTFLEYRRPVFKQCLAALNKLCPDKGRLLDVGCGTGEFLEDAIAEGWRAEGIESSLAAAEFAQTHKKLPVHHAVLENAPFARQSFAVITLLDVLEHLRDPQEELKRVRNLLHKRGIVVVRLPNTNFHLVKCHFCDVFHVPDYGLQMRYHLNHFTPATMKRLLRQTGFEPFRIDVGASETIAHAPWVAPGVKRLYVHVCGLVKAITGLHFGNILVAYGRRID